MADRYHSEFVCSLIVDTYRTVRATFNLSPTALKRAERRDLATIARWCSTVPEDPDGFKALTQLLPSLGDWAVQMCVNAGIGGEIPHVPAGFKTNKHGYPAFMGPIWQFVRASARLSLRSSERPWTVDGLPIYGESRWGKPVRLPASPQRAAKLLEMVRTVTQSLKKLELPYDEKQITEKLNNFARIEQELQFVCPLLDKRYAPVVDHLRVFTERWLGNYVPTCDRPGHGPGAVSGGEKGDEKWNWSYRFASVDRFFPVDEFLSGIKEQLGLHATANWSPSQGIGERGGLEKFSVLENGALVWNFVPQLQAGSLSVVRSDAPHFLALPHKGYRWQELPELVSSMGGSRRWVHAVRPLARSFYGYSFPLRATGPNLCRGLVDAVPVARLVAVPKDSRGPRLIACEPKEMMFVQQGVARHLMSYIERHTLSGGQVNFTSQEVNRTLARVNSRTRQFATLDLSDASDRVSLDLIRLCFPTRVADALIGLRSERVAWGDRVSRPMHKYAIMGSALCFPVESCVFFSLAVAALASAGVSHPEKSVFVYGDDIIVPTEHARLVMDVLEGAGLKVNREKSYVGPAQFRESCGMDAFNGEPCAPFRLRRPIPVSRRDCAGIEAWHDLLWRMPEEYATTRQFLRKSIEMALGEHLPVSRNRMPFFTAPHSTIGTLRRVPSRWNSQLQRLEVLGSFVVRKQQKSRLRGWVRLLANLVTDQRERERYVKPASGPGVVRVKWFPATGVDAAYLMGA